jgi:hypothetical protein
MQIDDHAHARREVLCPYREGLVVVAICQDCGDAKLRAPTSCDTGLPIIGTLVIDSPASATAVTR